MIRIQRKGEILRNFQISRGRGFTQRSPLPGLIFLSPSHSSNSVGRVSILVIGAEIFILEIEGEGIGSLISLSVHVRRPFHGGLAKTLEKSAKKPEVPR